MKTSINELLKIAGLPLREEDASAEHIKSEKETFEKAMECLEKVNKIAEDRLAEKDLTPEHKAHYTALKTCVKTCSETMQKHLDSYK